MKYPENDYKRKLVIAEFESGAVRISPGKPVEWTTGYWMPMYVKNEKLLAFYEYRMLVNDGFRMIIKNENVLYDVIAGLTTSPVSFGTTLADSLKSPFIVVRPESKKHANVGSSTAELDGKYVILIEDVISTGGNAARGIQQIRNKGGRTSLCIGIYTYNFLKSWQIFNGESEFDSSGSRLLEPCKLITLFDYEDLIKIGKEEGKITVSNIAELEEWREDPFVWGENHGFPPVKK